MLASALLVMLSLSAGEWDARVATVSSYADRLEAVVVEEGAAAEKTARLAALRERLGAGADSAESFAALYTAFDETRAWLLAHSQERPAVAEGVFEETQEHWRITTKDLTLTWRRDTLGMEVSAGGQTWAFGESDKLDIQMEAGRLVGEQRLGPADFLQHRVRVLRRQVNHDLRPLAVRRHMQREAGGLLKIRERHHQARGPAGEEALRPHRTRVS